MLEPVPDEELICGMHGEIGGLVMIKRDLFRARHAPMAGTRSDGSYRTDAEQIEWQLANAEIYLEFGIKPVRQAN